MMCHASVSRHFSFHFPVGPAEKLYCEHYVSLLLTEDYQKPSIQLATTLFNVLLTSKCVKLQ